LQLFKNYKNLKMKKNLNLTMLLAIMALAACQKEMPQQTEDDVLTSVASAKAGGSTGSGTVYLTVTVEDNTTDGTPTNIRSDAYNNDGSPKAYIHGVEKVEAQILSSDGNFYMQTNNNTTTAPIRNLRFPFYTALENKHQYRLRTRNTGTWLQNLPDGEHIMGFRVWANRPKGVLDWNMVFDTGQDAGTTLVKVTRSGNTWTIESIAPSTAKLTDGSGQPLPSESNGYHAVPFKMMLTAK